MKQTLIIAEAGVNHNGDVELAKKLIDKAKECGADIVKFQTAKLSALVSKSAPTAKYQQKNIGGEASQKEMLEKILLKYEDFVILAKHCKNCGIEFLSTPFDLESIDFLRDLVRLWKIPSGEITNLPYLIRIAQTGKPIILSTGMSEMQEIADAVNILKQHGAKDITLLHCNTEYPTPFRDVNLRAMESMRHEFCLDVGYSDHTKGIEIPIAAVAMGASVIEKHFTLDRNMPGPDHKASLEPAELAEMIRCIRNVEQAFGDGCKRTTASEAPNKAVARKSIVAVRDIKKGELFTEENLTTKRPGSGISPMNWFKVLGTAAPRNFQEDELIEL